MEAGCGEHRRAGGKYFTADLKKLVERLSTGNLTVEAFTQEGNRYFEMVYQERGE